MSLDDIPTPVLEVAIVLVAGLAAVTAVVVTGAVIGLAFWVAMRLEDRAQERNAETTRSL